MIDFKPYGQYALEAIDKPTVYFTPDVLEKISYVVDNSTQEVGWLCTVEKENNFYTINELYLFEQEVNGATCEISPESLAKLAEELMEAGDFETLQSLGCWGHSHVNMEVNPSSQDEDMMKLFKENGNKWYIRIICNKKGNIKVDFFDFEHGITFRNLQWKIIKYYTPGLEDDIKAQLKEKVKTKTYVTTYGKNSSTYGSSYGSSYGNYYGSYYDDYYGYDKGSTSKNIQTAGTNATTTSGNVTTKPEDDDSKWQYYSNKKNFQELFNVTDLEEIADLTDLNVFSGLKQKFGTFRICTDYFYYTEACKMRDMAKDILEDLSKYIETHTGKAQ